MPSNNGTLHELRMKIAFTPGHVPSHVVQASQMESAQNLGKRVMKHRYDRSDCQLASTYF